MHISRLESEVDSNHDSIFIEIDDNLVYIADPTRFFGFFLFNF